MNPNLNIFFSVWGGAGEGGAKVSDFFFQRIQIQKNFFLGGGWRVGEWGKGAGGGGGGLELVNFFKESSSKKKKKKNLGESKSKFSFAGGEKGGGRVEG